MLLLQASMTLLLSQLLLGIRLWHLKNNGLVSRGTAPH